MLGLRQGLLASGCDHQLSARLVRPSPLITGSLIPSPNITPPPPPRGRTDYPNNAVFEVDYSKAGFCDICSTTSS